MSGYRFHPGYTRVGGVLYDFNDRVLNRIQAVLDSFPKVYADMEKLLFRNRIFLDRLRGVGVLSKADAIAYSCSGPIARASGVTYDLRKDEPYLAYPELRLRGPLHDRGRLLGAVHRPDGGDAAEPPDHPAGRQEPAVRPGQRADRREVPAARQADGLQQHGGPDPALRADHAQPRLRDARATRSTRRSRAPNGELGYYLVADGSQSAWRVRTRPPSFIHFSSSRS